MPDSKHTGEITHINKKSKYGLIVSRDKVYVFYENYNKFKSGDKVEFKAELGPLSDLRGIQRYIAISITKLEE